MKTRQTKKLFALLLSFVMLLGILPLTALAEEEVPAPAVSVALKSNPDKALKQVGAEVAVVYEVTNTGNVPVTCNANLKEDGSGNPIPSDSYTYVAEGAVHGTFVDPGETFTITITYKVLAADVAAGKMVRTYAQIANVISMYGTGRYTASPVAVEIPLVEELPPSLIDFVEANDTQVPEVGKDVDWTLPTLPSDAKYDFLLINGEPCYVWVEHDNPVDDYEDLYDTYSWYYSNYDNELTFEAGKYYTLAIYLVPKVGYAFPQIADMSGKIDGTPVELSDFEAESFRCVTLMRTYGPLEAVIPSTPTISITPETATVAKGETQDFDATVKGLEDDSVQWSIESEHANGTDIDQNGLLTIADDETAEELTIQAKANGVTATVLTATAKVTVTAPAGPGGDETERWTIVIPVNKIVAKKDDAGNPPSEVVSFELRSPWGDSILPDTYSIETLTTNEGVGENPQDIVITVTDGSTMGTLVDGFLFFEKPLDNEKWHSSDAMYFIRFGDDDKILVHEAEKAPVAEDAEEGLWGCGDAIVDVAEFTNTYIVSTTSGSDNDIATGDSSQIVLWISLAGVSLFGMIAVLANKKRLFNK